MSFLGKLLVGFQLALSIIFLGFAGATDEGACAQRRSTRNIAPEAPSAALHCFERGFATPCGKTPCAFASFCQVRPPSCSRARSPP